MNEQDQEDCKKKTTNENRDALSQDKETRESFANILSALSESSQEPSDVFVATQNENRRDDLSEKTLTPLSAWGEYHRLCRYMKITKSRSKLVRKNGKLLSKVQAFEMAQEIIHDFAAKVRKIEQSVADEMKRLRDAYNVVAGSEVPCMPLPFRYDLFNLCKPDYLVRSVSEQTTIKDYVVRPSLISFKMSHGLKCLRAGSISKLEIGGLGRNKLNALTYHEHLVIILAELVLAQNEFYLEALADSDEPTPMTYALALLSNMQGVSLFPSAGAMEIILREIAEHRDAMIRVMSYRESSLAVPAFREYMEDMGRRAHSYRRKFNNA